MADSKKPTPSKKTKAPAKKVAPKATTPAAAKKKSAAKADATAKKTTAVVKSPAGLAPITNPKPKAEKRKGILGWFKRR